jgi:hypothetical protein
VVVVARLVAGFTGLPNLSWHFLGSPSLGMSTAAKSALVTAVVITIQPSAIIRILQTTPTGLTAQVGQVLILLILLEGESFECLFLFN